MVLLILQDKDKNKSFDMSTQHVWAEFSCVLEAYYRNYPNNKEENMSKYKETEKLAADESVSRHLPIPSASYSLHTSSSSTEYPSGYLPPEDDAISILRLYQGCCSNRVVARFYAREWLKRRRDETGGSQSLLWQLRQVLRMTEAVTSGAHARSLHRTGHSFGRSGASIIETALSAFRSGECGISLHMNDSLDEALEEERGLLLWAIYFKDEGCIPYWLKN